MKKFNLPIYYQANIIEEVRKIREKYDPRKKDLSPTIIELKKPQECVSQGVKIILF